MNLVSILASEFEYTCSQVIAFSNSAPKRYKVYRIPKRTSGSRVIAHPSRLLKSFQRIVVYHLEKILPVHDSAMAYRKGLSIRDNASRHAQSKYLLKMDFQNFFNSIDPALFRKVIEEQDIDVSESDKILLRRLLFWSPSKKSTGRLILSVGAPSSPMVSNFVMFPFDEIVTKYCQGLGIVYTRYADDITFSTNTKGLLFSLPDYIKKVLLQVYGGRISINEAKTVFSSKAHNRHVTGVTITNKGTLSIGRDRKRLISSLVHNYKLGNLPEEDVLYLQGLLSFAFNVEPLFRGRLIKKYSNSTLKEIFSYKGNSDA